MKDRFEEFVQKHAEEFDILEPREQLWDNIEKKLDTHKTINWRLIISRTAAIAAIFIISFVIQKVFMSNGIPMANKEVKIDIPELKEAEMYYDNMISTKLNEVKPLLNEHPYLEQELNTDLHELDSIYNNLKNDLKDDIANHEVLEAMIQNYRLRIEILEEMVTYLKPENEEINQINPEYEL